MNSKTNKAVMRVLTALLIVGLFLAASPAAPVNAASAVRYPGTVANSGGTDWQNPTRVTANDDLYSFADLAIGATSNSLHATGFDFAIPPTAAVDGIEVTIGRLADFENAIQDSSVQLLKAGAEVGSNAALSDHWPIVEAQANYGGPADLWNETWTAADINDPAFGVSLRVDNIDPSFPSQAWVDYIRVTVTYTYNSTTLMVYGSGFPGHAFNYGSSQNLSAKLTPSLPGRMIEFSLDGEPACSAMTDELGIATCNSNVLLPAGYYPSGISATFAGGGGYAPSRDTGFIYIDPRPITVTADNRAKTYGDADPTLTYTFNRPLIGDDTFSGSLERTAGEDANVYPITQGTLALSDNYDLIFVGANFTINPLSVTVTADDISKTYGDDDPDLTYIFDPALVSGDTFTGSLIREVGEDADVYAINQGTLALNDNYNLSFVGADFTINPLAVTVTADDRNKTYGESDPPLTYTVDPALVSGDSFTGEIERAAGEDADVYVIGQGTLDLNSNYDLSFVEGDFTINPLAISVTAHDRSKTYGAPDPSLTYSVSPALISGDYFTGELARAAGRNVGTYAITQGTLDISDNYDLVSFTDADFTITPLEIFVSAVPDMKVYDGSTDSSSLPSISPYAYGDTPAFIQTFDTKDVGPGKKLTPSGSMIDGNDGNNYNVNLVPAMVGEITPLTVTVTTDAAGKTYGDTDPELTYSSNPALADGDSFTGALVREPGEDVDTYAITQGSLDLSDNYVLSFVGADFTIDPLAITVTADDLSKTYGDVDPELTYIYNPALVTGDSFTGDLERAAGEDADVYTIGQGSLDLNSNYTLSFVEGDFTIDPRAITVTAVADTKVYDGSTASSGVPGITGTIRTGDTPAFTQTFDDKNVGTAKEITPSGSVNDGNGGSNYTITFQSVDVGTVTPLEITVMAVPDTKIYDGTTASLIRPFVIGTLAAGDTADFTQAFDNKNFGLNKAIIPSGSVIDGNDGDNYDVTFQSVDAGNILQSLITVTAVTDTKVYDGTTASSGVPSITGNLAAGDTAQFIQTFDDANTGTGKVLTPSGSVDDGNDGGNYIINVVTIDTGAVTPLAVTVTADALSKPFGAVEPELTYTVHPALASGDSFSGALVREPGEAVGLYDIFQGTVDLNENYALTFVGADFTIVKADQSITVTKTAPLKAYVGSSFSVAASSSSSLPVTFSAFGACSNTGAVFTITKNGTCFVQFDQPGDDSYNPAPQVVRTVNQEGMPVFYQFFPLTHR